MQRMMKTNEVANVLDIAPHAVRVLLRRGDIPGVKIGRNWYVSTEAFEAFVRGGSNVADRR